MKIVKKPITIGPAVWQKIVKHPLRCDLCKEEATWAHPAGGFRCDSCPRPNK